MIEAQISRALTKLFCWIHQNLSCTKCEKLHRGIDEFLKVHILCCFPMAAIKNYHKFSGLKQSNLVFYSTRGQKPQMGLTGLHTRYKVQQDCVLSGGSRENLFPCLSQLPEATCIPWLIVPFWLQSQQWLAYSFSHHVTLTLLPSSLFLLCLVCPPPSLTGPLELHWTHLGSIIQDSLHLKNLN